MLKMTLFRTGLENIPLAGVIPDQWKYAVANVPHEEPWFWEGKETPLTEGDRSSLVLTARKRLHAIGIDQIYGMPALEDNLFDNRLADMVRYFQNEVGLELNGKLDFNTWHVLNQYAYEAGEGRRPKFGISDDAYAIGQRAYTDVATIGNDQDYIGAEGSVEVVKKSMGEVAGELPQDNTTVSAGWAMDAAMGPKGQPKEILAPPEPGPEPGPKKQAGVGDTVKYVLIAIVIYLVVKSFKK